ncbi:MUC3B protein, partial [Alcedo cyanopectus]|nr:MUC3B protein [Ceyx cyanopectus]
PVPPDPCLNGGRWTGLGCDCPPNLEGDHCQFAAPTINITAELGPSVLLVTRVTNRDFSVDMGDPSAAAHRSFVEEFGRTMDRIYHNVSGYRGIQVQSLRRGSVVVNYKVLLHPPPGDAPSTSPERRAQQLLEAAKAAAQPSNCSHPTGRSPCPPPSSRLGASSSLGLSSPELCWKYSPANFSRFYYPHRVGNSLLCITNCTLNVPGTISCHGG